jgi:hypothetical protein
MNRNLLLASLIGGGLVGGAIWYRRQKRRNTAWSIYNSLAEVAQAHAEYLRVKHPTYHEKFENLLNSDREAALGEAAVFSLLKTYFRVHPEPADEPGTGGVDFVCRKDTAEMFVVEVTSLKPNHPLSTDGPCLDWPFCQAQKERGNVPSRSLFLFGAVHISGQDRS